MKMPAGLEQLPDLALNVRWTWSHAADTLWQQLEPDIWSATHNPWLILQSVSSARLQQCAEDGAFLQNLQRVASLRADYLSRRTWCSESGIADPPLVAYFCLEFGLAEALPLYAGGLGILAGDQLKSASDLGIPMIGVGLLYSEGYFRQMLDAAGDQHELYPPNAPSSLPITEALDASGSPLSIALNLPGRRLTVRIWQVQVGRAHLLLLDCNDPRNGAADRGITATLYPSNPETRFVQQLVLGVGGWRALDALGHQPAICHINEGHAALVTFERAGALMRSQKLAFEQSLWALRPGNLFTSHTPVAAAFDVFPADLVLKYLRPYLEEAGIGEEAFLALGRRDPADATQDFIPSYFALRTCGRVNAVSRIHQGVSRKLFMHLYPRRPVDEIPVGHITNGVHVPSWDSLWADDVWTRACGKGRWLGGVEELTPAIAALDGPTLWELKSRGRAALVDYVRLRLARQIRQRGLDGPLLEASEHMLDPNALTIGFARRFTAYKRPNLLLRDPERLVRLLSSSRRPVQIIVAGKAHPQDQEGKAMIRQWMDFCGRSDARARAVFLEDYDIDLARKLVQGIDVWINTPRRPWEACGTSGMKVLVNGGLNLSVLDGWWAEAYEPEVGWTLQGRGEAADGDADAAEARSLYDLLEQKVLPLFYERNAEGIAQGWTAMMRASMSRLAPHFSSNRMLREYFESAYCPGAAAYARRCGNGAKLALELQAWAAELHAGWHAVHVSNFTCRREGPKLCCALQVYLGEIRPDSVAVELYADSVGGEAQVTQAMQRRAAIGGATNAYIYTLELETGRPAGDFTPRVVPFHPEASVPLEIDLIHWG